MFPGHPQYVPEAAAEPRRKGEGNLRVNVYVNGSLLAEDMHKSMSVGKDSLVYEQIYIALVHEMTHVAEMAFVQDAPRAPGGTPEYYNSPHEVRAFMQMIVDELEGVLPRYAMLEKRFGSGKALSMFLNFSQTWGKVEKYWTEVNKHKVIKTVAQLIDEGRP